MKIIGIGLANIDLVAHVGEGFLRKYKLPKGQATKLVDLDFGRLRAELPSFEAVAGGCAGNTLCGLANAGFDTRFYGKTGTDPFESVYRAGFRQYGVAYDVPPLSGESSQCAVLITPDGERTFAYMHGASWHLDTNDLDMADIGSAALVYAEIYAMAFGKDGGLWPHLVNRLRETRTPLALKVMDREYAALYRSALFALAEEGILRLVIGNQDNLPTLAGKDNPDDSIDAFGKWACMTLMTRGGQGAEFIHGKTHIRHRITPITDVRNTSGAGDQFAAGFLEAYLQGLPVEVCLKRADRRALEIIMYDSPRPPLEHGAAGSLKF